MSFTFVNKNLLIPQVEIYSDFNSPIQKLLNMTYNMDKLYCSNLYVVSIDCIYFSNNNYLYSVSNTNIIKKVDVNIPTKSFLKSINDFLNLDTCEKNSDILDCDMNIKFNIRENTNIIIQDEPTTNKNESNQIMELDTTIKVKPVGKEVKPEIRPEIRPKTQEELDLIKLCEDTMELYQTEVRKIKDIEQQIKVLDNNKKSLLKKRKEKLFTNFSKLKNDYNTFKMIKRKIEKNPNMNVPSLFALKYLYFEQITKVETDSEILEQLEDINLDEVLHKDCELNEDLTHIANKYGEESKKLNVIFEHSWEDLEYETESNEINNSRFGY
jgi:hypothetical protein